MNKFSAPQDIAKLNLSWVQSIITPNVLPCKCKFIPSSKWDLFSKQMSINPHTLIYFIHSASHWISRPSVHTSGAHSRKSSVSSRKNCSTQTFASFAFLSFFSWVFDSLSDQCSRSLYSLQTIVIDLYI